LQLATLLAAVSFLTLLSLDLRLPIEKEKEMVPVAQKYTFKATETM